MRPETVSAPEADATTPVAVSFADLFDHLGADDLRYSAVALSLSGHTVAIDGYMAHAHAPGADASLVDQDGVCPDCAAVPVAAIALPGARPAFCGGESERVRVVGRLDYGFRIIDGVASMLRIEGAAVLPRDFSA